MSFKEVNIKDIEDNLISMVADEWMLVTAGSHDSFNTMTASWGFFGEIWHKECAVTVVRPSRYTYEFLNSNDCFSLSFMGNNRDVHKICGSKSGRDVDKVTQTGITPVFSDGTVYFEEARVVVICRKLYVSDILPEKFCDRECLESYGGDNYHRAYVGEIVKVLIQD